jgi:hypothetical protein
MRHGASGYANIKVQDAQLIGGVHHPSRTSAGASPHNRSSA